MAKNVKDKILLKDKFDVSNLSSIMQSYFRQIYPKSGVLFLTSEPGKAKSAIMRQIADDLVIKKCFHKEYIGQGLQYIDLRLSMLDETDVGLYPSKKEMSVKVYDNEGNLTYEKNGKDVMLEEKEVLTHIAPEWAFLANEQPTLIHFEELNRAPLSVRNAALQVLLERAVGYNFKFNEDVYMVSTGNLGEEDDTDVEEFDTALKGRLIHRKHIMELQDWLEGYATEHIHPVIIDFLSLNAEFYYTSKDARGDDTNAFATPRTWTFLSDFIRENYGFDEKLTVIAEELRLVGHTYVGEAANLALVKWIEESQKITIKDIMERYPEIKRQNSHEVDGVNLLLISRGKSSELVQKFNAYDLTKLINQPESHLENIKLFLLDISEDELAAFLQNVLENYVSEKADIQTKEEEFIIKKFLKDPRFSKIEDQLEDNTNIVETEKVEETEKEK